MAEEKIKDIKKERETKEAVPEVEKVETPEVEDLGIDKEAIEEIMRGQDEKIKNMEKDIGEAKGAQDKLSQVSKLLTGEETKEAEREKIYREFSDDPKGTIDKYAGTKSKAELAEIKGMLEGIKLEKADNQGMRMISSTDPDYEIVMKNISTYTTEEERKKYAGDESRFEILYGITKSRMSGKIAESKTSAGNAKTKAIEESNKTAVSEKPGGKEVAEPTQKNKRDKEIAEARYSFDSDKVADLATERLLEDSDFLKKWELDQ